MIPFHKGVKFITAVGHEKDGKSFFVEQRLSRALEWFTRWHKAWAKEELPKDEEGALAKAAAAIQLVKARAQYQKWKEQDKSRSAKYSRTKRGKKKDERCGARSDKERKALLSTVETVYGRKGAKMFIEQASQTTKQKTKP